MRRRGAEERLGESRRGERRKNDKGIEIFGFVVLSYERN